MGVNKLLGNIIIGQDVVLLLHSTRGVLTDHPVSYL